MKRYTLEDVEISRNSELTNYLNVPDTFLSFASRLRDYGVVEDYDLLSDPHFIEAYDMNESYLLDLSEKNEGEVTKIEAAILVAARLSSISRKEAIRRGLMKNPTEKETEVTIEDSEIIVTVRSPLLTNKEAREEFIAYSNLARSSYSFIPVWYSNEALHLSSDLTYSSLTLLTDYLRDNNDDITYKRIHNKAKTMAEKLDESKVLVGNLTPNFLYVDNLENIWIVDMSDSSIIEYETNTGVVKSKWDMALFSNGLRTFKKNYNYTSTFSGDDQEDEDEPYLSDIDEGIDIEDNDTYENMDDDELL